MILSSLEICSSIQEFLYLFIFPLYFLVNQELVYAIWEISINGSLMIFKKQSFTLILKATIICSRHRKEIKCLKLSPEKPWKLYHHEVKHDSYNYNSCTIEALSIPPLTNNFSSKNQSACQPKTPTQKFNNTKEQKPNLWDQYIDVKRQKRSLISLPTTSLLMTQKSATTKKRQEHRRGC